MCIVSGPKMPPPPPLVPPPPPPTQITLASPPPAALPMMNEKKTQLRADNPSTKRRGQSRRGKRMLKIPLNASSYRSVNV